MELCAAQPTKHFSLLSPPLLFLSLCLLLTACAPQKKHYVVGVSQCSMDIWRDKFNDELRTSALISDSFDIQIASANDDDRRQNAQINEMIDRGVDLLIVSPNQQTAITSALDRAHERGIPVILYDRKTSSQNYTAFIGCDNYLIGKAMGQHIAQSVGEHGRVVEITGLAGSSPAIERHRGFADALKDYPGIELVASVSGDWKESSGTRAMKTLLAQTRDFDYVFAHNDRMALGAAREAQRQGLKGRYRYTGVDALAARGGGLELVRDGVLDASYLYPTKGHEVLRLAHNILDKKPYRRDNYLQSSLVTRENVQLTLMEAKDTETQRHYLAALHQQVDSYVAQYKAQKVITIALIVILVLVVIIVVLVYRSMREKQRLKDKMMELDRSRLEFFASVSHELRTPLTVILDPMERLLEDSGIKGRSRDLLNLMHRNTLALRRLIDSILDFRAEEPAPENEPEPVEFTPPSTGTAASETVLVVDDNPDIRQYLRTILQDYYLVIEAEDGQKGLAMARREVPDLVVCDVMMPVMDGLAFCRELKGSVSTSHIPVVMVTAMALEEHRAEGYAQGADSYITKPFQSKVLLARISNLLRQRSLLRQHYSGAAPITDVKKDNAMDMREKSFLQQVTTIINDHLADSMFSVESIGQEMGLSRVQLYRKVKALTGTSVVDLLRKMRLARAKHLLETTRRSISEIAYDCGFSSPSYFTKCFKDELGKTPGEWAQRELRK